MTPDSDRHANGYRAAPGTSVRPIRLVALLSLGALALVPLGDVNLAFGALGAGVALVTGGISIRMRYWPSVRVASMAVLLAVTGVIGIPFNIWLVIGVLWIASRWMPVLTPDSRWLPAGRSSRGAWVLSALVVITAGAGLSLWASWTDEFGESTVDLIEITQNLPSAVLATAVLVFVILNAVNEEIAYRGIAFEAAVASLSPTMAVGAQAVTFATFHVVGFPAGIIGVGLAFGYGLALGALRHVTGGLRFPILAHMAADATIALLGLAILAK